MQGILTGLEEIVSNTNSTITKLEDFDAPDKHKNMNENLLNSLREYRDNVQAKYSFYSVNQTIS